ncbi:hypothetical protein DFJ74DRAFT_652074 [Hyaloraphidium curvatum]|nr:hypothetical protein DFJ74DRAFT_652074 [Hyaloraphidium curvatum]
MAEGRGSNYKYRQNLTFSANVPKFLQGYLGPKPGADTDDDDPDRPQVSKQPEVEDRPDDETEKPLVEVDPSNFTEEELQAFLKENPDAIVGEAKKRKDPSQIKNPLKRKMAEAQARNAEKKLAKEGEKDSKAAADGEGDGAGDSSAKELPPVESKSASTIGPTAKKAKAKPAGASSAAGVRNKGLLSFDEEGEG